MNISIDQFITKLKSARSIVVVLPDQPLLDQQSSGLALTQMLKNYGKNAILLGKSHPEFNLGDQRLITTEIKGNNLNITWPDSGNSVDQITTEVDREHGLFTIIVNTKPGQQPVDSNQIKFNYTGINADLIICLGCDISIVENPELQSLAKVPGNYIRLATTESLPSHPTAQDLINKEAIALCYMMLTICHYLHVTIDAQIATWILAGMEHRTERFANPNLSSAFFAAVSECLKVGGKRLALPTNSSAQPGQSQQPSSASNSTASPQPSSQPTPNPTVPAWLNPNLKNLDYMSQSRSGLPISPDPATIQKV